MTPLRASSLWQAIGLVCVLAVPVLAQPSPGAPTNPSPALYATVFRSPATGLEYRAGRFGVHAGFYPTILTVEGADDGENTNFVRFGVTAYLRPTGWTPYVTPSIVVSLDDDWGNGALTEVGIRLPVGRRVAIRGGVGVLTTFDGETRVNPTIGLDIRLGKRR